MVWRAQVELKQTAEKLHVQDITTTMNLTEAFKLMMKEKEALIAEKYRLNDKVFRSTIALASSTRLRIGTHCRILSGIQSSTDCFRRLLLVTREQVYLFARYYCSQRIRGS